MCHDTIYKNQMYGKDFLIDLATPDLSIEICTCAIWGKRHSTFFYNRTGIILSFILIIICHYKKTSTTNYLSFFPLIFALVLLESASVDFVFACSSSNRFCFCKRNFSFSNLFFLECNKGIFTAIFS